MERKEEEKYHPLKKYGYFFVKTMSFQLLIKVCHMV